MRSPLHQQCGGMPRISRKTHFRSSLGTPEEHLVSRVRCFNRVCAWVACAFLLSLQTLNITHCRPTYQLRLPLRTRFGTPEALSKEMPENLGNQNANQEAKACLKEYLRSLVLFPSPHTHTDTHIHTMEAEEINPSD